MEKVLPEECHGNFSTQPYQNRILLADLFEHSPEPFPCAAVIYLNAEMYTNPHTSSYVSKMHWYKLGMWIAVCVSLSTDRANLHFALQYTWYSTLK